MIESMTGFARVEGQGDWGSAIWELKTVNHRYFDCSLRAGESFRGLEIPLREKARQSLKRGKLDATLHYMASTGGAVNIQLDEALVKGLTQAATSVSKVLQSKEAIPVFEILKYPGVLSVSPSHLDETSNALMALFERGLETLCQVRAKEGDALKKVLLEKNHVLKSAVAEIETLRKPRAEVFREKLNALLEQANIVADPTRLEQELVIFTQKIDVTEEIDRLKAHLAELESILQEGGQVGRRLDFLMQELHRETNTITAKSQDAATTKCALNMKVTIEQMKEQIQNIN